MWLPTKMVADRFCGMEVGEVDREEGGSIVLLRGRLLWELKEKMLREGENIFLTSVMDLKRRGGRRLSDWISVQ